MRDLELKPASTIAFLVVAIALVGMPGLPTSATAHACSPPSSGWHQPQGLTLDSAEIPTDGVVSTRLVASEAGDGIDFANLQQLVVEVVSAAGESVSGTSRGLILDARAGGWEQQLDVLVVWRADVPLPSGGSYTLSVSDYGYGGLEEPRWTVSADFRTTADQLGPAPVPALAVERLRTNAERRGDERCCATDNEDNWCFSDGGEVCFATRWVHDPVVTLSIGVADDPGQMLVHIDQPADQARRVVAADGTATIDITFDAYDPGPWCVTAHTERLGDEAPSEPTTVCVDADKMEPYEPITGQYWADSCVATSPFLEETTDSRGVSTPVSGDNVDGCSAGAGAGGLGWGLGLMMLMAGLRRQMG